jgi:N-acetylmuramoyl-L-alanine amidase
MPAELRRGACGEAVRDLKRRLAALGLDTLADPPADFESATEQAVRSFQESRRLRVDGIVGRQTWSALVESGFALGDRLLYYRRPMLRGDDVGELQRRLNELGFDAGREDAILGEETRAALVELQRSAAIADDGICGPTTIAALRRVGKLAAGSPASLRQREAMRMGSRTLVGRRVYVAAAPGLTALGEQVTRGLSEAGASVTLDGWGDDDSQLAAAANRYEADLFLALRPGDPGGCRCTYFESGRFRSERGFAVASAISEELTPLLPSSAGVAGKAYAALRETRMTAVVCELVDEGDAEGMGRLVAAAGDVGRALVRGVRRAIEQPPVDDPPVQGSAEGGA